VQLDHLIAAFQQETVWHPQSVASFAGALAYSKYGFLKRLVMKRIARQAGGETDTSHDYEYYRLGGSDALCREFCRHASPCSETECDWFLAISDHSHT
jgi:menaquinone-dependent protoporphyrinogen IX oxidase